MSRSLPKMSAGQWSLWERLACAFARMMAEYGRLARSVACPGRQPGTLAWLHRPSRWGRQCRLRQSSLPCCQPFLVFLPMLSLPVQSSAGAPGLSSEPTKGRFVDVKAGCRVSSLCVARSVPVSCCPIMAPSYAAESEESPALMIAEVLVPEGAWGGRNRRALFTYRIPPALRPLLQPGQLVALPFGPRLTQGIIWTLAEEASGASAPTSEMGSVEAGQRSFQLREIARLLDKAPVLLPHQQALAEWMADYYCASLPACVQPMIPPGLGDGLRLVLNEDAGGPGAAPDGQENANGSPEPAAPALLGL